MNKINNYTKKNAQNYASNNSIEKNYSCKHLYTVVGSDLDKQVVLDAGCGAGEDLVHYVSHGAQTYGIDSSQEMINLAHKNCPQARLTLGSFVEMPYQDNYFDLVVSKYAVQHERNLEKTYREFARVLKPGGRLVILATHPITLWLAKSHKDYFTKEEVILPLYNSKVIVRDEAQTMMDYLNQTALTNFKLLSLEEGFEPTTENQLPPAIYPTYLILNMVKAN